MLGYEFYQINYGGDAVPQKKWERFSAKAKRKVDLLTFGRTSKMQPLTEEVSFCICEVADYLYYESNRKKEITSESMDGHSVSFAQKTDAQIEKEIESIVKEHLINTGLLYRGQSAGL